MKTKVKNTIIFIIALTVLCLSCYYIYDKKIKENTNNVINEADETTKKFLINVINEYGLDALSYEYDNVKFDNKLSNGILYLAFNYISKNDDSYLNHFEDSIKWEIDKSKFDDYFNHAYGFSFHLFTCLSCYICRYQRRFKI